MKRVNKVKNGIFNTILIAVCSFVGVGFITGAEIWFYFARFENASWFGVAIFGILSFILPMFCVSVGSTKDLKISRVKTKISIVGEMAVASAMVSGLFETTKLIFGNWWFLTFVIAINLIIFLFFYEKKSFLIYNYFVAIFIIFVIFSLFSFDNFSTVQNNSNYKRNFSYKNAFLACLFACFYVFSNISELRPILEKNSKHNTKKDNLKLCFILSLLLIFLVIALEFVFFRNIELSKFSMPFLILFKTKGGVSLLLFMIGLIMTMISTAESCLIGVNDKLNYDKKDEKFTKTIVIILLLIFGQLPFRFFIKLIYPIVAIFNFIIFLIEIFELKFISKNKIDKCK